MQVEARDNLKTIQLLKEDNSTLNAEVTTLKNNLTKLTADNAILSEELAYISIEKDQEIAGLVSETSSLKTLVRELLDTQTKIKRELEETKTHLSIYSAAFTQVQNKYIEVTKRFIPRKNPYPKLCEPLTLCEIEPNGIPACGPALNEFGSNFDTDPSTPVLSLDVLAS